MPTRSSSSTPVRSFPQVRWSTPSICSSTGRESVKKGTTFELMSPQRHRELSVSPWDINSSAVPFLENIQVVHKNRRSMEPVTDFPKRIGLVADRRVIQQ